MSPFKVNSLVSREDFEALNKAARKEDFKIIVSPTFAKVARAHGVRDDEMIVARRVPMCGDE